MLRTITLDVELACRKCSYKQKAVLQTLRGNTNTQILEFLQKEIAIHQRRHSVTGDWEMKWSPKEEMRLLM